MVRVRAGVVWACGLLLVCGAPLSAQLRQSVGPAKCVDCHDHSAEKDWWQTKDGEPAKGKQHIKADRRLEDPKAATYSKALGLSDVYNPSGACVSCHATVVSGSADFGVSCESCHGPGRDYLTPHQTKGTYAAAVKLGMADIKEKPEAWAPTCLGCHVLASRPNMQPLIAAGHSSGSDFDLVRAFPAVAQHFKTKYQPGQIAAAAAAFKPAAVPVTSPVVVPIPKPESTAKIVTPVSPTPAVTPTPTPTPASPVVAPPVPSPRASTSDARAIPVPQPQRRATAATPVSLPPIAPAPAVAAVAPAASPQAAPAKPETPDGHVATLQGRAAAWLTQLLNRNVQATIPAPPAARQVYGGHDAELLRLQDQVLRLALEALAMPSRAQQ